MRREPFSSCQLITANLIVAIECLHRNKFLSASDHGKFPRRMSGARFFAVSPLLIRPQKRNPEAHDSQIPFSYSIYFS